MEYCFQSQKRKPNRQLTLNPSNLFNLKNLSELLQLLATQKNGDDLISNWRRFGAAIATSSLILFCPRSPKPTFDLISINIALTSFKLNIILLNTNSDVVIVAGDKEHRCKERLVIASKEWLEVKKLSKRELESRNM